MLTEICGYATLQPELCISKSCDNLCPDADWLSKSSGYWTRYLLQRFTESTHTAMAQLTSNRA